MTALKVRRAGRGANLSAELTLGAKRLARAFRYGPSSWIVAVYDYDGDPTPPVLPDLEAAERWLAEHGPRIAARHALNNALAGILGALVDDRNCDASVSLSYRRLLDLLEAVRRGNRDACAVVDLAIDRRNELVAAEPLLQGEVDRG